MNRIDEFLSQLEQPKRISGLQKEAASADAGNIEDLGIEGISFTKKTSENLEKIATALSKRTTTTEDLIKLAEEAGNSDIGNLVKIADALAERIAERAISRIEEYFKG